MATAEGVSLGEVEVIRETEKAILVRFDDDDPEREQQRWIPKSVVHDDSEVWSNDHGEGELIVKEWWAEANGLC